MHTKGNLTYTMPSNNITFCQSQNYATHPQLITFNILKINTLPPVLKFKFKTIYNRYSNLKFISKKICHLGGLSCIFVAKTMKKIITYNYAKKVFIALACIVTLSSCNNEDAPVMPNNGTPEQQATQSLLRSPEEAVDIALDALSILGNQSKSRGEVRNIDFSSPVKIIHK